MSGFEVPWSFSKRNLYQYLSVPLKLRVAKMRSVQHLSQSQVTIKLDALKDTSELLFEDIC